jgi:hypothetical protein
MESDIPQPDTIKASIPQKVAVLLDGMKKKFLNAGPYDFEWSEDMCAYLKTEIERKPEGIHTDTLIEDAYNKLEAFLGKPTKAGVSLEAMKKRILFTDNATTIAFRQFFEKPGQDSDTYWHSPLKEIMKGRPRHEAARIFFAEAYANEKSGYIFISSDRDFPSEGSPEALNLAKQGISKEKFNLIKMRWMVTHEMAHFLYGAKLHQIFILQEALIDDTCTELYPELLDITERFSLSKEVTQDFLKRAGFTSMQELFKIPVDRFPKHKLAKAAKQTNSHFFKDLNYEISLILPKELLGK